jgi:hypothetical protein
MNKQQFIEQHKQDRKDAHVEQWLDVVGYEGLYMASDKGRVKRLVGKGCRKERQLKPIDKDGYVVYGLSKGNKTAMCTAHRIMMIAFNGASELTVDHLDGDKGNNVLSNLEYVCDRTNVSRRFGNDVPTSKHRGISYHKQSGKWRAQVTKNKKHMWSAYFDTELDALNAYTNYIALLKS